MQEIAYYCLERDGYYAQPESAHQEQTTRPDSFDPIWQTMRAVCHAEGRLNGLDEAAAELDRAYPANGAPATYVRNLKAKP